MFTAHVLADESLFYEVFVQSLNLLKLQYDVIFARKYALTSSFIIVFTSEQDDVTHTDEDQDDTQREYPADCRVYADGVQEINVRSTAASHPDTDLHVVSRAESDLAAVASPEIDLPQAQYTNIIRDVIEATEEDNSPSCASCCTPAGKIFMIEIQGPDTFY